jgi:hypothetical protein
MAATKELAKAKTSAMTIAEGFDYGEDAGSGFENVTQADLSIPFFVVLQSNSPEVEDKTVEGAESGMIMNTVTKELHKELYVLPVDKISEYLEWKPRAQGGGLVDHHELAGPVVLAAIANNNGSTYGDLMHGLNELSETHSVYVSTFDPDTNMTTGFGVISFASTKIKPYKGWITSMLMLKPRPPMFALRTRIRTVKQKNEKGSFFNFQITNAFGANWMESQSNCSGRSSPHDRSQGFPGDGPVRRKGCRL